MSIYLQIYNNLCNNRSKSLSEWSTPKSNLHRHHIIQKHSGGINEELNYAYLTIREHIIAHFLLWKIYKNPNDLRAMKMLGAKLTYNQRSAVGKWCFKNKIGMFSDENAVKLQESRKRGNETQRKNKIGAYYNPELKKEIASKGGKASIKSEKNPWSYWASPEGRVQRAKLGAKAIQGRTVMYKPGDSTFKRIKKEEVSKYLELGYIFGAPKR
jgi:hypothetical protein